MYARIPGEPGQHRESLGLNLLGTSPDMPLSAEGGFDSRSTKPMTVFNGLLPLAPDSPHHRRFHNHDTHDHQADIDKDHPVRRRLDEKPPP
jgi:hypothetical protein